MNISWTFVTDFLTFETLWLPFITLTAISSERNSRSGNHVTYLDLSFST